MKYDIKLDLAYKVCSLPWFVVVRHLIRPETSRRISFPFTPPAVPAVPGSRTPPFIQATAQSHLGQRRPTHNRLAQKVQHDNG
jgi:hypothetical protein